MKVLFICNLGKYRSPTAAMLWAEMFGDETDSTGITRDENEVRVMLEWADVIYVMEDRQRAWIGKNYPQLYLKKKIDWKVRRVKI